MAQVRLAEIAANVWLKGYFGSQSAGWESQPCSANTTILPSRSARIERIQNLGLGFKRTGGGELRHEYLLTNQTRVPEHAAFRFRFSAQLASLENFSLIEETFFHDP